MILKIKRKTKEGSRPIDIFNKDDFDGAKSQPFIGKASGRVAKADAAKILLLSTYPPFHFLNILEYLLKCRPLRSVFSFY